VAVSEVDYPTGNNQMNGARMAMRVFKRNLIKQVRSWQDNALPENRLKRLNEEVKEYPKNFINLASKFGAL
jgi:ribosome recycling factor